MSRNKAKRMGQRQSVQQMGRWKRRLAVGMGATCVVAACLAIRMVGGPHSASAGPPSGPAPAGTGAAQKPQIMATVNTEQIRARTGPGVPFALRQGSARGDGQ